MRFGRYHFHSVFEDDAYLPPFKGSTFRGVFGVALKRVVCALKRQECPDCLLREQCIYARVFEDSAGWNHGDRPTTASPSPPHPFVIEPPLSSRTVHPKGSSFDFRLLLFGYANDSLPYFVYALEQMGSLGIGKKHEGKRASFRIDSMTSDHGSSYNGEERRLETQAPPDIALADFSTKLKSPNRVRLSLDTPLRLKFQNRLQAELPFHVLIRAALRRLAALNRHFGNGEPDIDYRGLVARAQAVRPASQQLRWFDWRRYSNRQEQAMLMGGMIGTITYEGAVGEFLPLLKYCETVHLGKATSFGLGKITVTPEDDA